MRTVTFYPSYYPSYVVHNYKIARGWVDMVTSVETTQMCLLNHVKDYDMIRIVNSDDDVIEIVNNHDGTYSCDRTQRVLRRVNDFYKLWENGEFDL